VTLFSRLTRVIVYAPCCAIPARPRDPARRYRSLPQRWAWQSPQNDLGSNPRFRALRTMLDTLPLPGSCQRPLKRTLTATLSGVGLLSLGFATAFACDGER
jgi:hypothetical protein